MSVIRKNILRKKQAKYERWADKIKSGDYKDIRHAVILEFQRKGFTVMQGYPNYKNIDFNRIVMFKIFPEENLYALMVKKDDKEGILNTSR